MDIGTPFRELGEVPMQALLARVLELDEAAWHNQEYRQETYEVYRQTESLVLIFTDDAGWPDIEVSKQPGYDELTAVALSDAGYHRQILSPGRHPHSINKQFPGAGLPGRKTDSYPDGRLTHRQTGFWSRPVSGRPWSGGSGVFAVYHYPARP
jgi:hypothetical protein